MFTCTDIFGYEKKLNSEQEVLNFAFSQLPFSDKKSSKLTNRVNSMKSGSSFFVDYGVTSISISKD